LTARARAGKLDPVIGRDAEVSEFLAFFFSQSFSCQAIYDIYVSLSQLHTDSGSI
jgi:hypothetical protein